MMADTTQYHPLNPVSKPPMNRKNNHQTLSKEHYAKHLGKKQSLPTSSSFPKDDALLGGNLLDKPNVERSLSWGNLTQLSLVDPQRSLSASNLYALNNPDLSIKAAISKKAYDKPHTSFSKEKAIFTAWAQKYYHQLTVGCGNEKCRNVFCRSSPQRKKFDAKMISLISIELAGYKNHHLCVKDKKRQAAKVLDPNIFKSEAVDEDSKQTDNVPFLYRFYSMSPFRSLFLPCPLTPSGLGLHKTHSQGELSTPSKTKPINDHQNSPENDSHYADSFKSHLTSLTNTISNSVSNIFLYASQSDVTEETITDDGRHYQQRKSLDEKVITQRKYENKESINVSSERKRIPSVRVFGEEHAVDTSLHSDNIDDFEMSVAAEFQQKDDVAYKSSSVKDILVSEDDEEDAFDDDGEGEISDGYSLTHLTLDMFQNIVQNYLDCDDEAFLLNTIRTVFASWDSLMLSFQHEGIPTEKQFLFNVNMVDVVETFNLLQKIDKNEKFLIILADTLQVMLLKKQSIREGKELKPLVLMLAIPYLFKYVDVVHEISTMISSLSHSSLLALSQFIGECFKPNQFEYLVQVQGFYCF